MEIWKNKLRAGGANFIARPRAQSCLATPLCPSYLRGWILGLLIKIMPPLFKVATHKRSKLSNMSHHIDSFLFVFRACSIRVGAFLVKLISDVQIMVISCLHDYRACVFDVCFVSARLRRWFYLYLTFMLFERMCFWNGAFLMSIFHIYLSVGISFSIPIPTLNLFLGMYR